MSPDPFNPRNPRKGKPWAARWALSGGLLLLCLAALAALALACIPALFGKDVGAGFASVERSLCVLAPDGSAGILVGGDSRAKVQVDPAILDSITGLKAVNIAENITFGGDLPTLANVLRKYPRVLASSPVLVLSVSVTGLNDMALDDLPAAAVLNWTPWDHARVALRRPGGYARFAFGWYLPFLKRHVAHKARGDGFSCDDGARLPPALVASRGFRPENGPARLPGPGDGGGTQRGDFLLDGGRLRAFAAALEWLAASPASAILLYIAPMEPAWRKDPEHAVDMEMEARLAALVAEAAARHPRVRFVDFVRDPPAGLAREHFHDNYHLNGRGASIFSRLLGEFILREGMARGRDR